MSEPLLEIDGSFGEGGGQVLRTSLALSLITGRAFRISKIRRGRTKPGLQAQHLACVNAAAAISGAQVRGAALNSTEVTFEPGPVAAGNYCFDTRTAGATGLVLQTVYLPLAMRAGAVSEVKFIGGTHVPWSPCFHFLDVTWRGYLELIGLDVRLRLQRAGFYPRGGGVVEAVVQPFSALAGLTLPERGKLTKASGFSAVAGLPQDIARRQARRASSRLEDAGLEVDIREETLTGGLGTVLAVVLETEPVPALFFGLGARSKSAEAVADEAVDQALAYLKVAPAVVDPHSADQIVLPLALAEGPSTFTVSEVTQHLLTNIAVIGRFLERTIECDGAEGGAGCVRIG